MTRTNVSWKAAAKKLFSSGLLSDRHAFVFDELAQVLHERRSQIGIPRSTTAEQFVAELLKGGDLREVRVLPKGGQGARRVRRSFVRYVWNRASAIEVALTLRPNSYASHGTAARLLGITGKAADRLIYANKEQAPKSIPSGNLSQEAIDRAFSNEPRVSNYVFEYQKHQIVLLSGKHTFDYEVIAGRDQFGAKVRHTALERTLYDITVRPAYAGGVNEVLRAYYAARSRLSIPKLVEVIKRLGHLYPYHQAVGFYLTRVGFTPGELAQIGRLGLRFNFYLENKTRDRQLDTEWRIYFPRGLLDLN